MPTCEVVMQISNKMGKIFSTSLPPRLSRLKVIDFEIIKVIIQFSSVAQSCPILCDPMNHSTPGLPVLHHLPEFTQTHVHRVSVAIQPSHLGRPLLLLPPIAPSIRVFSNESTLRMRWPKYTLILIYKAGDIPFDPEEMKAKASLSQSCPADSL